MSQSNAADQRSKRELRRDVLAVRGRLSADEVEANTRSLTRRVLELPEVAGADSVAAYVAIGTEPGTGPLLEALRARGTRVLLPVLLPDNDLDWAEYEGPEAFVRAGRGLLEPSGTRLGREAVTEAGVVLLPGLAVDGRGIRLGRGAGCYDRVLSRLAYSASEPARVVLLYDTELVERVPSEEHDRAVDMAVTPAAVHRFGAAGR